MAKQRVYELARDLDHESKEVLQRAQELGIDVKTASSGLDEDSVALVRLSYEEESGTSAGEEDAGEVPQESPAAVTEEAPQAAAEADAAAAPAAAEAVDEPLPEPVAAAPDEDPSPPEGGLPLLEVEEGITAAEFARLARQGIGAVVRTLMEMGELANANAPVPNDAFEALGEMYGYRIVVTAAPEIPEDEGPAAPVRLVFDDAEEDLEPRPPVVTVMGHVDHGKTKLLDTIRKTNVVAGEAGGITQHIGAYQVRRDGNLITFIDTPGHEAFTALRARGAIVTDIVVLVVAADDGVMPQTAEAISHAQAAGVPIIIAVNKMDLPTADPFRVRSQLTEYGLVVEELGGEVLDAEISALEGEGVAHLLELVDLTAELEELKGNPNAPAKGTVIESQLDKGRGPVATLVVQRGTLRVGDAVVAGPVSGRVRAMFDENGKSIKEATPSTPLLMMGWNEVPTAGDVFEVAPDERAARSIAEDRRTEIRSETLIVPTAQERLTQLLETLRAADSTELRVVVKADAHGSLEALREAINKITRQDATVEIILSAVGGITENDIILAEASDAIVFGFNVRPDGPARRAAERYAIDVRTYRVIYELLEDVEQMLVGRLAPEQQEILLGVAEVRATFRAPRYGFVAGCYVTEGAMVRNARVRLVRDGVVVYDGNIASLRRFKEDVPEVAAGFECGIGLENFRDIKEGDSLESYEVREVART